MQFLGPLTARRLLDRGRRDAREERGRPRGHRAAHDRRSTGGRGIHNSGLLDQVTPISVNFDLSKKS